MTINKKQLAKAVTLSRKFFGFNPRIVEEMDLKIPTAMTHIGGCPEVHYINDKWTGRLVQYFHKFNKDCQIYAFPDPQKNGDNVLVIRGKFKITKDGLIG